MAYVRHLLRDMQPDSSPPARYASLCRNGRSQAVRIPKEFELDGDRVGQFRRGRELRVENWQAGRSM